MENDPEAPGASLPADRPSVLFDISNSAPDLRETPKVSNDGDNQIAAQAEDREDALLAAPTGDIVTAEQSVSDGSIGTTAATAATTTTTAADTTTAIDTSAAPTETAPTSSESTFEAALSLHFSEELSKATQPAVENDSKESNKDDATAEAHEDAELEATHPFLIEEADSGAEPADRDESDDDAYSPVVDEKDAEAKEESDDAYSPVVDDTPAQGEDKCPSDIVVPGDASHTKESVDENSDSSSSDSSSSDDDAEEGEVNEDSDEESAAASPAAAGDDDFEEPDTGPLKTKNEILDEPVKPIDVEISPDEKIEKLGVIQSIVGKLVIVAGLSTGEYQVVDQGSVLVFADRTPFGRVFETLGPVQKPLYSVKFSSDAEAAKYWPDIQKEVYYAVRYSTIAYTSEIKAIKGSDASNWNDEEVDENEQEFSDDEAEMEHRRRLKQKENQKKKKDAPKQENNQSPRLRRPTAAVATASGVSFGDLAGEDVAFLNQVAAEAEAKKRKPEDDNGDDDDYEPEYEPTDSSITAGAGSSTKDTGKRQKTESAGNNSTAAIVDEEPYHTLTRPTGLLLRKDQPPPPRRSSPTNSRSNGGRPGFSDAASPEFGGNLTHTQKRRLRRKRKKIHEGDGENGSWGQSGSDAGARQGDFARGAPRTAEPADYQSNPYQRPVAQRGDWRSQSSSSRPYQQPPPATQPSQYNPSYPGNAPAPFYGQQQQPDIQNFAHQLPPGAHINPAFVAQLAMQQQQPPEQLPPQPFVQAPAPVQPTPSPFAPYQSQPAPLMQPQPQQQTQAYLNMLQAQLRQQLLTRVSAPPLIQQDPIPAPIQASIQPPPQPVMPAPAPNYQNQTQAQLQQQLQALLHQMQVNAAQSSQQAGPAPAAAPPASNAPGDAYSQVQYQLNLLGVLGAGASQQQPQQPPGPNNGGRGAPPPGRY